MEEEPLFPADAHTMQPRLQACWTAVSISGSAVPPRLRLMTFAPLSAAHVMPLATLSDEPFPVLSSTFTGMIFTWEVSDPDLPFQPAIPATPVLLFVSAAAMPAQWVPWP